MNISIRLIFIILKNEIKEFIKFFFILKKPFIFKNYSINFKDYLKKNVIFWKGHYVKSSNLDKKIYISLYYSNPEHIIPNLIIGKFLSPS